MKRVSKISRCSAKGFSLVELIVVLVAGGILLTVSISMYQKFRLIHQQQQRVIDVERDLTFIKVKLSQALTSLPGRQLGIFNGTNFVVPTDLPANGTAVTANGTKPIELGFVTPYRVNRNDAVTILAGSNELPRLELIESSKILNATTGSAKVALLNPYRGVASKLNLNAGDLMLIVGSLPLPPTLKTPDYPATSRLVKLTKPPTNMTYGTPSRTVAELEYDLCTSGKCSSLFPQLTNTSTTMTFGEGSVIVPLKLVNFYLLKGQQGSDVVRNEGGTFVPDPNGGFQISGGQDSVLGSADSMTITYQLAGSAADLPTPATPIGFPFSQVEAVNVSLSKTVPAAIGNAPITRTISASYPLRALVLQK